MTKAINYRKTRDMRVHLKMIDGTIKEGILERQKIDGSVTLKIGDIPYILVCSREFEDDNENIFLGDLGIDQMFFLLTEDGVE